MIYTEDAEALMAQALAAGGTLRQAVAPQFWGDKMGQFEDPYGHRWSLATRVEIVSPEEMQQRAAAWAAKPNR